MSWVVELSDIELGITKRVKITCKDCGYSPNHSLGWRVGCSWSMSDEEAVKREISRTFHKCENYGHE